LQHRHYGALAACGEALALAGRAGGRAGLGLGFPSVVLLALAFAVAPQTRIDRSCATESRSPRGDPSVGYGVCGGLQRLGRARRLDESLVGLAVVLEPGRELGGSGGEGDARGLHHVAAKGVATHATNNRAHAKWDDL